MKKSSFFLVSFLLVIWMLPVVCFGGEIFLNYSEESVSSGDLEEYRHSFETSFGKSKEDIRNPSEKLSGLLKSLEWLRDESDPEKILREIQKIVNSLKYLPEAVDHWSTIGQTIDSGGGDCDEFAVAKAVLVEIFLPDAKIFLVQGFKSISDDNHIVVIVRVEKEVFVLDNDRDELVIADDCDYLIPYLAIDVRSENFFILSPEKQPASLLAEYEGK
ncbi:MAG: hypothetical protein UR69_C0001G0016 [Candidatus Moranbacteria bacterium GW2011_GWE2_35_2-]|nr:MAG: hypothetical protein UR69_C0001G0016 [Candidatus Moranbacteria bacterium GW2011_GWE2_35_2-]KKQ22986.1 MAG: hypothetical protein US37_C0001G0258 [Candidatus Moranbacteria bacterium GW2011_GWF2_37_11]KKQ29344.1 MAG: hypothetical protein US44_C0002G0126 [Candidatus Moranbacteria bacterium GW2011_GWD1_37_17]KKQ30783.1 MAG: hypothetical protein US47_C0001G0016 [Candidatus Moranbacteria bacterium GW2011_GWE1_37_24]KKQ48014.1 MAG: hypothetical protein US66_C0003G0068 [Candidatus Moranbacteria 